MASPYLTRYNNDGDSGGGGDYSYQDVTQGAGPASQPARRKAPVPGVDIPGNVPSAADRAARANRLSAQVTQAFSSGTPPLPPDTPAAPTPTAYERGQSFRSGAAKVANAAGGALIGALRANVQPIADIAVPTAQFLRGAAGVAQDATLSPISNAEAATPTQPQPTQLPPMTVRPPPTAAAPAAPTAPAPADGGAGARVAAGRTFGTRAADGSVAFSNVPVAIGYDPGYNRAGDNINTLPGAVSGAPAGGAAATAPATYNPQADIADNAAKAQSDTNAILSHDFRSPLGVTARNLSLDLPNQVRSSRYGGGVSPYVQAIDGLIGGVRAGQAANDAAALERGRGESETQRTVIGEKGKENVERLKLAGELQKPSYQTDADGNLVQVTGTGATNVTRGGQPLAVSGKINASEEKIYAQALKDARDQGVDDPVAAAQEAVHGYRATNARGGEQPAAKAAAPKAGETRSGYRFKGGNPNDKANWEKV